MNTYEIIYWFFHVFETYTLFKFMNIFFDRIEVNKKNELVSYILYYFIIGIIHLTFCSPTINFISNLILFTLITLLYTSTWKFRLIAVVLIYTILLSVETFVFLCFNFINIKYYFPDSNVEFVLSFYSANIISYAAALALSNFKMIKNKVYITAIHWSSIFLIPMGSLILFSMIMFFIDNLITNIINVLICIAILLLINVIVFYLYDTLTIAYQERMEKILLQQQNNAYIKQLELINQSQENLALFRHDMRHHLFSLHSLIEKGDNETALSYLQETFNYMDYTTELSKSGNTVVDSILNYKLQTAKNLGIDIELKLDIPTRLNIQPFDMSVILGNLLDNAIEATDKLTDNKKITISVEYDRNVLYISTSNYYEGTLIYYDNKLITTKDDKENHGLGLNSVKKVLERYNGTMKIHQSDNIFYIDVLLFNPV